MADVIDARGENRGQLFLVTALALAVLFIGLSLLFNTAIYTENIGSRNAGVASADATAYRASTTDATAEVMASVNRHNFTSTQALSSNLSAELGNWSRAAGTHAAHRGRVTSLTLADTNNGTRVAHDESAREFTSATGGTDWTVVGSTANVRAFRMNVSRTSLADDPADVTASDAFHVNVTDQDGGGDTWRVHVYRVQANVETRVAVEDPSGAVTTYPAGNATDVPIDLTAGTVNGTYRPALDFWGDTTGNLSVRYGNADNATGRYKLVVPASLASVDDSDVHGGTDASSPYATAAVYAATVSFGYESADISFHGVVRVAPGEAR